MLAHPAYVRRNARYGADDAPLTDAEAYTILGVTGVVLAIGAVQVFGINPWVVKAFKPEWSYGRRLAASFGVTFVAGTLVGIAKGLGGAGATSTPAATK